MKHSLFIITVILVVLAAAAYGPGEDTQGRKNPFGTLGKTGNTKSAEGDDSTTTGSELVETQATEVFNLNFANAKEMEKTFNKLVSNEGKVGVDNRLNSLVVTDTPANLKNPSGLRTLHFLVEKPLGSDFRSFAKAA